MEAEEVETEPALNVVKKVIYPENVLQPVVAVVVIEVLKNVTNAKKKATSLETVQQEVVLEELEIELVSNVVKKVTYPENVLKVEGLA